MQFSRINRFKPAALAIPFVFAAPLACAQDLATTLEQIVTDAAGGIFELAGSTDVRPTLGASQISGFLPSKGAFTFPSPWNSEAVRLTNADDCGGADCVAPVGYSYWNNINNHAGFETMLIFVGLDRNEGGAGPSLLEYNKSSGELRSLGTLFADDHPLSWHSGEGWYFSGSQPTKLYINDGADLLRYDVMSREFETVFDGSEHGIGYIWQVHSSADDRVHSATVRDPDSYAMQGCMAFEENTGKLHYFPAEGDYDECQVDKSGRWLLIKENVDGADGEDNRIIDLQTGSERVILDREGAAGHSDMGFGYMIAADNFADTPNTQKLWRFDSETLSGVPVYSGSDWNVDAPAHVSHSNARDLAPEEQFACGSSVNRNKGNAANEIVCFALDGSGRSVAVAPVMTDLDAAGGGSDDYLKAPKGNLDVTGEYFIWTSNTAGGRLDAFLVKVPSARLLDGAGK